MIPKRSGQKPDFISHSEVLATDYHVFVETPVVPGPLPVVMFLDGDYIFDFAVKACRELRTKGLLPPVLVAAVGYGLSFGEPGNHRGRDYTPSASGEEPESGGANAFLEHLTGPLWEELSKRHPVSEQRLIAGHSLGGLFALHALFQEKPFFSGALVGAPSVWWNQRHFLGELAKLRANKASLQGRLFLGIGEEDTESMLEDFGMLEGQLHTKPFRELLIEFRRFAGLNHYDLAPSLVAEGLPWLLHGDTQ